MKKTEELRQEADKLEKAISDAVQKFHEEVGECDINIDVNSQFVRNELGEKHFVDSTVKVSINI